MNKTFQFDFWEHTQSKIEFIPTNAIPQDIPLTAVKGLLIKDNKILLTKVKRGWDIPSGHIEEGETPEQALIREVMEETGATVNSFALLGYMRLTKVQENEINKKYPSLSAIPVYISKEFITPEKFDAQFEAEESELVPQSDILKYHHGWTPMWDDILEYAKEELEKK